MSVQRPTSEEELQSIIASAASRREPLCIQGYDSKRVLGRALSDGSTVCLTGLEGVRLYEPNEMVLSAAAGTSLEVIRETLSAEGQRLAFDPPDWGRLLTGGPSKQTIGGIVSVNQAGSSRLTAGATRDHVIGFRALNGLGEIIRGGGRVVKNVTGYDLPKLLTGSWGTLAALSEITLRVIPSCEYSSTLAFPAHGADDAVGALSKILAGPFAVAAAAWLPQPEALRVGLDQSVGLLKFEGITQSVIERAASVRALLRRDATMIEMEQSERLWQSIGCGDPLAVEGHAIWRVSVPPSSGPRLLAAVAPTSGFLDWGGGLVWLASGEADHEAACLIRTIASAHGGHATLMRAPKALRDAIGTFQPRDSATCRIEARLKASFDPYSILNPGRLN